MCGRFKKYRTRKTSKQQPTRIAKYKLRFLQLFFGLLNNFSMFAESFHNITS